MFPGVSTEVIAKALEKKENNVIPPLPRVIATSMDLEGQVTILFDQDIMIPDEMSNKLWDVLIEV